MRSEIVDKLRIELNREINTEPQVVYVLSRIRKILEITREKSKYPILNLYCNWVLHSEITETEGKKVNLMLREFIEVPENKYKLSFHLDFLRELNDFLNKNALPTFNNGKWIKFRFLLTNIISETPIEVKTGIKYIASLS